MCNIVLSVSPNTGAFQKIALIKVVSYYDCSVLSMSAMGFQKKFGWGWVDGVSSIQVYFRFLKFV